MTVRTHVPTFHEKVSGIFFRTARERPRLLRLKNEFENENGSPATRQRTEKVSISLIFCVDHYRDRPLLYLVCVRSRFYELCPFRNQAVILLKFPEESTDFGSRKQTETPSPRNSGSDRPFFGLAGWSCARSDGS
jgi:hypothetical protein